MITNDMTIVPFSKHCTQCKVNLPVNSFKIKRNGEFTRQCINCLDIKIRSKRNNFCQHRMVRCNCKQCNDPIPITIKSMILHSKASDKMNNRYDQTNFIDYCFVENLIDDCKNKCFYCDCDLQYVNYADNLATIERLDNSIGHIKGNCVIACRTCNYSRAGQIPI